MAIFEEASEREHRQKEGHSGITYVYGKYMEYPPPGRKPLLVLQYPRTMIVQKYTKGVYYYDN